LSQRRDHHTLNIDPEAFAIDWPVEHPWGIDAVAAQGSGLRRPFESPSTSPQASIRGDRRSQ
jgi:hypothetical protein